MNFLRPREEARILQVPKGSLLDELILRVPLQTGLSPSEFVDLDIDDVSYEYGLLFVWRSKTTKDHLSLCDSETLLTMYQYQDKRQRGPFFLFRGPEGPITTKKMKTQAMRRTVKHYAKKAEISRHKRITPYTLRHTFCIKWILEGGTLEGLRRQLGHRSLQKLQHYLDFDYKHVIGEYRSIFEHPTGLPEDPIIPLTWQHMKPRDTYQNRKKLQMLKVLQDARRDTDD